MLGLVSQKRQDLTIAGFNIRIGDRLAAKIRIVPLLDGRVEGIHVDVDYLALSDPRELPDRRRPRRSRRLPGRIFLDAAGHDPERAVR